MEIGKRNIQTQFTQEREFDKCYSNSCALKSSQTNCAEEKRTHLQHHPSTN